VAAALVRQLKRATVVTAQQTDAIGVCDSFTEAEYRLLKNDKLRNEMFADAIAHVATCAAGLFRWADMGTGGFAFLSAHILDACDAHRVTAVEVQQGAFESAARWLREKCRDGARFRVLHSVCSSVGLADMVDGEPCDAMVGELVGNIASSEGIVAAVADWRARGLCRPGAVFVPGKVATYYRLAHLKGAHFRRGTRSSPTRVSSTIALGTINIDRCSISHQLGTLEELNLNSPASVCSRCDRRWPSPLTSPRVSSTLSCCGWPWRTL
jgi:hypothetical protein